MRTAPRTSSDGTPKKPLRRGSFRNPANPAIGFACCCVVAVVVAVVVVVMPGATRFAARYPGPRGWLMADERSSIADGCPPDRAASSGTRAARRGGARHHVSK